jgi:hypothetical protein
VAPNATAAAPTRHSAVWPRHYRYSFSQQNSFFTGSTADRPYGQIPAPAGGYLSTPGQVGAAPALSSRRPAPGENR